ncbi:hypothetical protein ACHAWF_006131 [Thalassiosira exigua]
MDVEDSLCEQRRDAQLHELLIRRPLWRAGDGVQNDTFLQLRVRDPLVPRTAQEPVRREREDASRPLGHEHVGGLAQRTRRVDHVVHDDAIAVHHVSHEVHLVHDSRPRPLLDDHGDSGFLPPVLVRQSVLELLGAVHAPCIRADDDRVVQVLPPEVVDAHDAPLEVVHGHARAEEALDLSAVQVHGDDAIDSHGLEEAGDVSGRDGDPSLHLAILSGVAIVGDDDRDAPGRGAVEAGDHEQQLHEVVVDGGAGGLNDVDVLPADVLVDHDVDLAVREAAHGGPAEVDAQELGDLQRQAHVAVAAEELEATAVLLSFEGGGLEAGLLGRHVRARLGGGVGGRRHSSGDGARGVDGGDSRSFLSSWRRRGHVLHHRLRRRLGRRRRRGFLFLQLLRRPFLQFHLHHVLGADAVRRHGISHGPHPFAEGGPTSDGARRGRGGGQGQKARRVRVQGPSAPPSLRLRRQRPRGRRREEGGLRRARLGETSRCGCEDRGDGNEAA